MEDGQTFPRPNSRARDKKAILVESIGLSLRAAVDSLEGTLSMLKYHAAYYQGESGWVVAKVLDFPGALSQGRTLASARRMVRDALRVMAETLIEEGDPLPRPNPRARDKTAIFQEIIPVRIQVPTGVKS